jgi:uncharacterized SAM-binding protein YcdF (DUF218 family)
MAEKKTGGKAASTQKKKSPQKQAAPQKAAPKTAAKKPAPKQTPTKKAPPKKPTTAKRAPQKQTAQPKKTQPVRKPVAPAEPQRRTIADRKVAWSKVDKWSLARWIMLIPLGFFAFSFGFLYVGCSFTALVCLALMGVLLFYNICAMLEKAYPHPTKVVKRVFTVLLCIGILILGVTEALILKASFGDPDPGCKYVVVLGAKVRHDGPSVSLQNRIDAAYDYLTAHPDAIAIVSGGKGEDEPMTEAECMYDGLIARGINPERIWLEDKATSTWENLQFSLDLIEEKTGIRPESIGIISSEYHLFRAGLFADACRVESVGIPAKTTLKSQKLNHFLREVAGVWHYILLGGQYEN